VYLLARKYPPDVNAPLFAIDLLPADEAATPVPEPAAEAASKTEAAPEAAKPSAGRFVCPSAFMVAIAFELEELVALMLMVRRARMRRDRRWHRGDGTKTTHRHARWPPRVVVFLLAGARQSGGLVVRDDAADAGGGRARPRQRDDRQLAARVRRGPDARPAVRPVPAHVAAPTAGQRAPAHVVCPAARGQPTGPAPLPRAGGAPACVHRGGRTGRGAAGRVVGGADGAGGRQLQLQRVAAPRGLRRRRGVPALQARRAPALPAGARRRSGQPRRRRPLAAAVRWRDRTVSRWIRSKAHQGWRTAASWAFRASAACPASMSSAAVTA